MSKLCFNGREIATSSESKTVLDALLAAGEDVNYGCKSGVCLSCVVQSVDGDVPEVATKALSESQRALNYFLPCQCELQSEMSIASLDQEQLAVAGEVVLKDFLSSQVLRLRLKTDLEFRAGQFVTLWSPEGVGRSYSIASIPADGFIECHIKVISDGKFSQWLAATCQVGDAINIQGPMGLCFYQGLGTERLILVSIGTGFAPILGVLKDALSKGHSGNIDLLIGTKTLEGFYQKGLVEDLVSSNENVSVHWVCQEESSSDVVQSDVYAYAKEYFADLAGSKLFVCGAESFVRKLKRHAFMAGAGMGDIYADAFVSS